MLLSRTISSLRAAALMKKLRQVAARAHVQVLGNPASSYRWLPGDHHD
jgi:hypothetical protein